MAVVLSSSGRNVPEPDLLLGYAFAACLAERRVAVDNANVAIMVRSNFFPGTVSAVYLNEPGASFQHELVDDGTFGPMSEILSAIVF